MGHGKLKSNQLHFLSLICVLWSQTDHWAIDCLYYRSSLICSCIYINISVSTTKNYTQVRIKGFRRYEARGEGEREGAGGRGARCLLPGRVRGIGR